MSYDVYMSQPKEVLTLRVSPEVKAAITQLATSDDRTASWMAERLLVEALQSRGLIPAGEQRSS